MGKKGGKRHGAEQIVRKLRDAEAMPNAGTTIGVSHPFNDLTKMA